MGTISAALAHIRSPAHTANARARKTRGSRPGTLSA
jgi:hypothetical protein